MQHIVALCGGGGGGVGGAKLADGLQRHKSPDETTAPERVRYRSCHRLSDPATTSDSSTDLCLGILPHGFRPLVISLHITASDFPRSP
jgi:hypothetical protein